MSFGSRGGPAGAGAVVPRSLPGSRSLDLRPFCPVVSEGRARRWSHRIRHLDRGYRVAVPELAEMAGFDGDPLVGFWSPPGWGLRVAGARDLPAGRVEVDDRWRVPVPIGVRRRLGLTGSVVVSAATGGSQVVVWSTGLLDDVLEAGS